MAKYLLTSTINKEEALRIYIDEIKNNEMFIDEFDESLITLEEYYYCYGFYKSFIKDLKYFIKDQINNKIINGLIDMNTEYSSRGFIINNLSKDNAIEIEDEYEILNKTEFDKEYQFFIDKINDRLKLSITNVNRITPSKNVFIDVEPIKDFEEFSSDFYFEKVYLFRYRGSKKKDHITIMSSINKSFYRLKFEESLVYKEYLKHGRLFMIVPKYYLDEYDNEAFKTFRMAKKINEHMSDKDLYLKVKANIKNKENALYLDYLYLGIYYFKVRSFIKRIDINDENIKRRIYLSYLALGYNKDAGIFLYECAKLGLLYDNSLANQLRLLKKSYSLGSMHAKKYLYLHYSSYLYRDDYKLKKYS